MLLMRCHVKPQVQQNGDQVAVQCISAKAWSKGMEQVTSLVWCNMQYQYRQPVLQLKCAIKHLQRFTNFPFLAATRAGVYLGADGPTTQRHLQLASKSAAPLLDLQHVKYLLPPCLIYTEVHHA